MRINKAIHLESVFVSPVVLFRQFLAGSFYYLLSVHAQDRSTFVENFGRARQFFRAEDC